MTKYKSLHVVTFAMLIAACVSDVETSNFEPLSESDPGNDQEIVGAKVEGLAATAGCGDACNGKNPSGFRAHVPGVGTVNCGDDAVTVSDGYLASVGRTVQLRYSPKCRTAWARVWGGTRNDVLCLRQRESKESASATKVDSYAMSDPDGRNWSNMWNDAGIELQACVAPPLSPCLGPVSKPTTAFVCTGYY